VDQSNVPIRILDVQLLDDKSNERDILMSGETLQLRIIYEIVNLTADLRLYCQLLDHGGMLIHADNGIRIRMLGNNDTSASKQEAIMEYESLPLTQGDYFISIGVRNMSARKNVLEVTKPLRIQKAPDYSFGSVYIKSSWREQLLNHKYW
jgi:hypothetical protein